MRDTDIRNILKETILSKYYADSGCRVVEELEIPAAKARIDMAVINGHMHGFEIKSARDTLKRIPSQLAAYSKVFDFLSIVTEEKYQRKLVDILPTWVGIYICQDNGTVDEIRPSTLNLSKESFYIAKLLWRNEILDLLSANNFKYRKSDRNWILCELIAENLPLEILSQVVRTNLKNRISWKLK